MCLCCACRYKQLTQRKGELEDLEKHLKEQQEKMALENQTHRATADQYQLLKEDHDRSARPVSIVINYSNLMSK